MTISLPVLVANFRISAVEILPRSSPPSSPCSRLFHESTVLLRELSVQSVHQIVSQYFKYSLISCFAPVSKPFTHYALSHHTLPGAAVCTYWHLSPRLHSPFWKEKHGLTVLFPALAAAGAGAEAEAEAEAGAGAEAGAEAGACASVLFLSPWLDLGLGL